MEHTKKELDMLLLVRKKGVTDWKTIKKKLKLDDDETLNMMLSATSQLHFVESGENYVAGKIRLNHIGETVAQAEYDKRFDKYYSRAMSFLSICISVIALIISLA